MNRRAPLRSHLPAIIIALLMATSCGHGDLPDVPEFEMLGFSDALDVVRQQVFTVYEEWQEKPLDADRNGRLGMHLSVYRKSVAAEILYRRARVLAPDEFRWTYYLAFTLLDMGRSDEAVGMFREALKIDPGHADVRIQLAQLLLQGDDTEESRELYSAISVEFPDRVEGWLGLGKVYTRLDESDAAVAALERAREVGPQFGEVHYALAIALQASGDADAAARELAVHKRTVDNKIRAADELLLDVGALHIGDIPHMATGRYLREHAQFKEAAESFRAALNANPANQEAWVELVSTQAELGDIDATGETYREALAAGIVYARLHMAYGQALYDRRQLAAARDVIGKAIDLDPQYAEAYAVMGKIEMRSGASATAVGQFRLSLSARPNDRSVQLSLAQALIAAGQFEDAADQLAPLLNDAALDKSLTLKELALAYHGMDRDDQAIDALQRGREAARKSANVRTADEIDALLLEWQE